MHDQAVGQNLSECLNGENDQEDILHLFLSTRGIEEDGQLASSAHPLSFRSQQIRIFEIIKGRFPFFV